MRESGARLTLRAGDVALVSPYALQRRADYFPRPDQFDPDRFTASSEAKLPRYAYIPFGAGVRICIGNHLTTMIVHLLLLALAQQVTFALPEGRQVEPAIVFTLRLKRGTTLIVRRLKSGDL